MPSNLFYISFFGDKDAIPASLVEQVHHILLQEAVCLQLSTEDKNWLVLSEKDESALMDSINCRLTSDALYISPYTGDNPISSYIHHLESTLDDAKQVLLSLMQKNSDLMEENVTLKISRPQ
ncbi:MAG: hypothetical protein IJV06_10040 [Bacteroidaceae bacterium]|nr:hypothetical protein [Bacteroidaceae bacterium]